MEGGRREDGGGCEWCRGGRRCGAAVSGWHAGRRGAEVTGRDGEEVDGGWGGRGKEDGGREWRD